MMHRKDLIWKHFFGVVLFALTLGVALIFFDARELSAQSASEPVRVIQSDTSNIVLEFQVANYDARTVRVDTGAFTTLTIPGLDHTVEPGKPQLPIHGVMVAIPPGAQASLKIIADDARTDTLANPPLPMSTERAQINPREQLPRYGGASFAPDPATYAVNRFYPADAARIASASDWRSQHFVLVEFHPLQYNPATRQLVFHRRIRVEIALSYPRGKSAQTLGGSVNEGAFEQIFQQSFVNYASARNWRAPRASSAPTRAPRYSGGPWYKIALDTDGIYKVTCAQLQTAGVNTGTLNPATLQLFKQNAELAINVVGSTWNSSCGAGNYFEFFGMRATSKYTTTNTYWLTFGATTGIRMLSRDGSAAGTTPTVFTDTIHLEENHYYRGYMPFEDADHWFWNYIFSPSAFADYTFPLYRLATGAYSATLALNLAGYAGSPYTATLYVNGNYVGDTTWNGNLGNSAVVTYPQSYLTAGNNTIRVVNNSNGLGSILFVNNFDVGYNATFTAITDTLRFREETAGAWRYQISNFTNATIKVFDITDLYSVTRFINTSISGSPYTLAFGDTIASARAYLALTDAQEKSPLSITLDTASNLMSTSNGADYIAISYGAFIPNVQPLTNYRATQGMRVKLVDVQDVYDEFGDGLADPQAIHDFLQYAYTNWQAPAPAYALLVGDGTQDPIGYCIAADACPQGSIYYVTPPNSTLIPPYLRFVDPYIGETATDNRLVTFNVGNNLPSLAIGRLPANNAAEVDAMVNKILGNEQNPPNGSWRGTLTFIDDNPYDASGVLDSAGNFWDNSESVAGNPALMPFSFSAERIYYNPCYGTANSWCNNPPYPPYPTSSSAKTALLAAMNNGRLIVNYVGHSFLTYWAQEQFLNLGDIPSLTNVGKYPVMLEMTCYTGYFHFNDPSLSGLGETNVRASGKGALASWSATGLGVATGHDFLHRGFYDAVMRQGVRQIGPATVLGKQNLYTNAGVHLDLLDTFILLGDPATRLAFQPNVFLPAISR